MNDWSYTQLMTVCFQGKAGIPGSTGERGPHGEPVSMLTSIALMWLFLEPANKPQIVKSIMTVRVNMYKIIIS